MRDRERDHESEGITCRRRITRCGWDIITDLAASKDTIGAIQSIEILTEGQEFGVGTKWRETRTMFGKQATEVMWITHVNPGRSYTARAESHGAIYTTVMAVEARDDASSELSMDFGAESTGTMARIASADDWAALRKRNQEGCDPGSR